MKILLVSIINSYKYSNTGIDCLALHLRNTSKNTVDIKYYHNNESYEYIVNDIQVNKYELFGFSVFSTNYTLFCDIAAFIKRENNSAIVIMGGQFVTMNYMELVNECTFADYFVLGDGELPFDKIINYHTYNDKGFLYGDENIATRHDSKNKKLNIITSVNRIGVDDYYKEDLPERNRQKTHCLMTKTNVCTGNCSFCVSRKGKVLYRTPIDIVNEIEYYAKNFGVRKYFFCEDDFFDIDGSENRKRLEELLDLIDRLHLNIVFSGFAKAKSVSNPENLAILRKMSRVGFHNIFVGIDTGNEADRILYNKRSNLEDGLKSINVLSEVGIGPRYGLIFLNPFSTIETMRENYRYLVKLQSSNYYHYGGLRVQLLNGTRLLEKTKAEGLLKPEYSFLNTEAYTFKNAEVQVVADFLKYEFYPRIDNIKNQYNTLQRKYDLVKQIAPKEVVIYDNLVTKYKKIETDCLIKYFYHLYECVDVQYCRAHLYEFENDMKKRTETYYSLIKELNRIFKDTPLEVL